MDKKRLSSRACHSIVLSIVWYFGMPEYTMYGLVVAWYSCILAIVFSSLPGHQCGHAQHYQPRLCQHLEQLFSIGEIEYFPSERLDRRKRSHFVLIVHFTGRMKILVGQVKTGRSSSYVNLLQYDLWLRYRRSIITSDIYDYSQR